MFAACLAAFQALAEPQAVTGTWLLDETSMELFTLDSAPASPPPREITIKISIPQDNEQPIWAVDLTGQCNTYGARLEISDDTPVFSGLIQTAQYCPDWRRDFDKVLMAVVFGAERIKRTSDAIIFSGSAGDLHFIKSIK